MEQMQTVFEEAPLWSVLASATQLLETDPAEAERQALAALKAAPGQSQALQLLVSAKRVSGDVAGARATLEAMAAETPNLANLHYEIGLLLIEMGEADAAIRSLSRVIELEPEHTVAPRALADALVQAGNVEGAASAYAKQFASSTMDLKMLEQVAALDLDQIEVAGNMVREFLNIYRTDLTALLMLGRIYLRVNQFEAAEQAFAHALELDPSFENARLEYVAVLRHQMKSDEECRQVDILLQDDPDNRDYRYLKATALSGAGRHQEATEYCERLLKEEPDQPKLWTAYAYALRIAGRLEECISAFRKAVELDPGHGEAWWGLANLKTFHFAPDDVETMRAELSRGNLNDETQEYLHFALGKSLEDTGSYEQSFEHYRMANALVRARHPYDRDEVTRAVQREKRRFTHDFFVARAKLGCPSPDPIFILGMPRSGSTLVEQMLASHSTVEGAGELPYITTIARRLSQDERARPERSDGTEPPPFEGEDLRALGEEYLELCRTHRILGHRFFTDKAPNNFRYVGLICSMFPNAKIIDARRHPLACCFSNFKQIFPSRLGASYDLADMGHHYRDYVDLMAHYDRALPGRIHRVIYEELIHDPQKEVRRLLDYCGLAFEESCLRFYETDRKIQTVSSEQVRQPIYTGSLEQWRHYDRWLGSLKAALGPVLETYPAVPETI